MVIVVVMVNHPFKTLLLVLVLLLLLLLLNLASWTASTIMQLFKDRDDPKNGKKKRD